MSEAPFYFYNGANGGLGKHLAEALRAEPESFKIRSRLEAPESLRSELRSSPLRKGTRAVFLQLASLVSVPLCEAEPERARKTNVVDVTVSMKVFIEEALKAGAAPEILYVSSGHLYAQKRTGRILETDPLAPRSVYAKTKLEAEQALAELCRSTSVPLRIARVFGLIAPDQPANYVLPGLIRRARGKNLVGVPGLENERDYLDARDVCRTLVQLSEKPMAAGPKIVNVCSGEAVTIRRILELALKEIHGEDIARGLVQTITAGPSRPDDIPSIVGDPSRCVSLVGENPKKIPLEQTVREAARNVHL